MPRACVISDTAVESSAHARDDVEAQRSRMHTGLSQACPHHFPTQIKLKLPHDAQPHTHPPLSHTNLRLVGGGLRGEGEGQRDVLLGHLAGQQLHQVGGLARASGTRHQHELAVGQQGLGQELGPGGGVQGEPHRGLQHPAILQKI